MTDSASSESQLEDRDDRIQGVTPESVTSSELGSSVPVFYSEGRPSQVLLSIEQFEKLESQARAARLLAKFHDPSTKWMSLEEVGLKLAGSRIAAARKAKSMTQKQLAAKLKLPQSMISRIEKNPDRSTLKTLKKIAAALGVDIRALV
ncbi:MAG: helix-turn-helix domain-containing protein [Phycisphaerales bacterium]